MNMNEYDDLDWLYEVLYAANRDEFYENDFLEKMKDVINKNQKIHDASCGNGIQAVALAKNGFNVSASDISLKMVDLTKEKAQKNGLNFDIFVSSWKELPAKKVKYDVILCYGNSISHSISKEDRIQNLVSIRECLSGNGILILDSRNWEKIRNEKYTIYHEREYSNCKYIPIYIWNFNTEDSISTVDIIFIESNDGNLAIYKKTLSFSTFTHDEIVNEVKTVGYEVISDSYFEKCSEYVLTLKRLA
jgi:hypothetical protein